MLTAPQRRQHEPVRAHVSKENGSVVEVFSYRFDNRKLFKGGASLEDELGLALYVRMIVLLSFFPK